MNTIIVDHDNAYEPHQVRFNDIVQLLKTYGFLDKYIINPQEIQEYLHDDNQILYLITAAIPDLTQHHSGWFDSLTEISEDVINLANDGLIHIHYFIGEIAMFTAAELVQYTRKLLKELGIKQKAITIQLPNFDLAKPVYQVHKKHIKHIPIFEMSYRNYLMVPPGQCNIIKEINYEQRNKKYTCLNHITKIHREMIGASLFNEGLIEDGYFSYHITDEMIHAPDLKDQVDATEFNKHTPFILDYTDEEQINAHWEVEQRFFNNAYWNFVTETFVADYPVLTEKTFKPIANLQPFIILGPQGSLEILQQMGYRTFSPYIDESYDKITNNADRMEAAINLAIKLAKMSHTEHIALMKKCEIRLKHNQDRFFNKDWREII